MTPPYGPMLFSALHDMSAQSISVDLMNAS